MHHHSRGLVSTLNKALQESLDVLEVMEIPKVLEYAKPRYLFGAKALSVNLMIQKSTECPPFNCVQPPYCLTNPPRSNLIADSVDYQHFRPSHSHLHSPSFYSLLACHSVPLIINQEPLSHQDPQFSATNSPATLQTSNPSRLFVLLVIVLAPSNFGERLELQLQGNGCI